MTDGEILAEIHTDVKHIKCTLERQHKRIADVEDDVDKLRDFRARILGILTGAGAAGGAVGAILARLLGGT